MAVSVIALKCPECSSRLCGFDKDRVFFCPSCRAGWEPGEAGRFEKIELSYARPMKPPEKFRLRFYLPFYLYRLSAGCGQSPISARVAELLSRMDKVYVAGYRMTRESYFGEMALIYTEAGVILEDDKNLGDSDRARIGAGTRARDETQPYLRYYPLLIIDKRQDVTDMELCFETAFDKIWAVPFFDLGDQIQEGILGRTFPAIALDTIADFRKVRP